jgi:hypothetical protein
MSQQWYISRGSGEEGPFSARQLWRYASEGSLKPTDLVWAAGAVEWVPAARIKRLFPAQPPSPPPIPQSAPAQNPAMTGKLAKLTPSHYRRLVVILAVGAIAFVGLFAIAKSFSRSGGIFGLSGPRASVTMYFVLLEKDESGRTVIWLSDRKPTTGTVYHSFEAVHGAMQAAAMAKNIRCVFDEPPAAVELLYDGQVLTISGVQSPPPNQTQLEHCRIETRE